MGQDEKEGESSPWVGHSPGKPLSGGVTGAGLYYGEERWGLDVDMCCAVLRCSVVSDSLRPHGCNLPGSSVQGILQYWSELPCPPPGILPDPGIKPKSPTLQADSLPLSHQRSWDVEMSHQKDLLWDRLEYAGLEKGRPGEGGCGQAPRAWNCPLYHGWGAGFLPWGAPIVTILGGLCRLFSPCLTPGMLDSSLRAWLPTMPLWALTHLAIATLTQASPMTILPEGF